MTDTSYMKEKKILPLLLSMAIPMVISMVINSMYNIVDGIFVARIGEDAMMAVSLVYPLQNLINSIAIGTGVGVNAVIAMYLGSGNKDKASAAASQGILLNGLHGIIYMAAGILIVPAFLKMFTDNSDIIAYGVRYALIILSFSAVQTINITFEKIYQSVGRMTISMISLGGSCLINIILDPLLIFGPGPFPAMGITGAAIATGIGQTSGLLFYLTVWKIAPCDLDLSFKAAKPTRDIAKHIYSIGIPATLNLALPSLMISALNSILAAFSETSVLVLGIYYRLQTFLYLSANGVIQGMRPVMSYNYGAGETLRVKKLYRTTMCIIIIILAVGTVLCFAVPGQLIGLFTDNAATISSGAHAIQIIALGFIVSAVSVTSAGALEAIGKGVQSLSISVLRYICPIIPLAFILSRFMGADGVWNAFWITEFISAVYAYLIFRREYAKMVRACDHSRTVT